jgi:uncharacterized protein YjbJ (UPF0337 family)
MKGSAREWWGRLTDDDLERIGGKKDKLLGALQERYSWTHEHVEQELKERLESLEKQAQMQS